MDKETKARDTVGSPPSGDFWSFWSLTLEMFMHSLKSLCIDANKIDST
jgi:hypothetical protein